MADQNFFNVRGIDILSTGQNHVLLAINYIKKSIAIDPPYIAGAEPLATRSSIQVASSVASGLFQ